MLAIDIALVFHAAKTGRISSWCFIILMIPVAGALAHVIVELVPGWLGSYRGQKARAGIGRALNPEKGLPHASRTSLKSSDTIANRKALAHECIALGRFDEAKAQYDMILTMPRATSPDICSGRARAEFLASATCQSAGDA